MTATSPAKRLWLPLEGRALGVDWSGGKKSYKKIWHALVTFKDDGCVLDAVAKPFNSGGPPSIASRFLPWLNAQRFDVAGLDFCFGLHEDHARALGQLNGPAAAGAAIRTQYPTPEKFKAAVGAEKKRETDRRASAQFAPTNLRMFRQTYWGLASLSGLQASVPPWAHSATQNVVEVLPAQVARLIAPDCSFKEKGGPEERKRVLAALRRWCRMEIPDSLEPALLNDRCGDAIDAVLAAIAAGSAWAQGFAGVPTRASVSGEGWIYLAAEIPRPALPANGRPPASWPREVTAAHEAGHAIAYLACGIPVDYVDVVRRSDAGATQFGWTETKEETWTRENGLVNGDTRHVRRLLGRAGGLAGECVANLVHAEGTMRSSVRDRQRIGGSLQELGLLDAHATSTPTQLLITAVECAVELVQTHRVVFDALRRKLALEDQAKAVPLTASWGDADDQRVIARLRAALQVP